MPTWMQFELEVIPPRNKKTGSLNISGLAKRGEISPGGKRYPACTKDKANILEWYERDSVLLLKVIALPSRDLDFSPKIVTEAEAIAMKKDFFGITEEAESGVT